MCFSATASISAYGVISSIGAGLSAKQTQQTTVSFPLVLQNTVWKDALKGNADSLGTSVALAPYEYRILMH
ncbi:MAG: hypothetical protein FJ219_08160 [Ignavibacteria bacterium]|nr:hypothetical protein [Ignavibacteria bacterium]